VSTLKPTTARFVPDSADSPDELAIAALHLYAYTAATELVDAGSRVLDIGFGEGYGSRILAAAGCDYRGLETDPEMVAHATSRYGGVFELYDGTHLSGPDDAFDLVVAFQMLAYLDDPQPLLREVKRVLRPDGLLLATTPNRVYRLEEGERPWNRYHVREYTASEFARVLEETFGDVTVYGIFADEPIDSIVRARAARARRLARLDPLGLRYRLPERVNAPLRQAFRRTAQPAVDRSLFTLDRLRHERQASEEGLDLLAFARP
jgi:SAM-dependent methyltransferase